MTSSTPLHRRVNSELLEALKIVGLCTAGAILYGLVHDQITARICVEYFTVGHAPIGTDSPTLLGLFWGVVATWWFGLFLGILLAGAARIGPRHSRVSAGELRRPVVWLLVVCFVLAFSVGLVTYLRVDPTKVNLPPSITNRLSPSSDLPFLIDLWIHNTSYFVSGIGALILCGVVIVRRFWRRRIG